MIENPVLLQWTQPNTKMTIDAATGGVLMSKDKDETCELLEEMALNNYQWQSERVAPKIAGVHELDALSEIQAQLVLITKQLGAANVSAIQTPTPACNLCRGHTNDNGQDGNIFVFAQNEHANYINRQRSNNPYSNTYNSGWRNHANISWCNNNVMKPNNFQRQRHQRQPQSEKKSNLDETLAQLSASATASYDEHRSKPQEPCCIHT